VTRALTGASMGRAVRCSAAGLPLRVGAVARVAGAVAIVAGGVAGVASAVAGVAGAIE